MLFTGKAARCKIEKISPKQVSIQGAYVKLLYEHDAIGKYRSGPPGLVLIPRYARELLRITKAL